MIQPTNLSLPGAVALFPRLTKALSLPWNFLDSTFVVALSQSEDESSGCKAAWTGRDQPLLILRAPASQHADLVQEALLTRFPPAAGLALIVFDGPELPGYGEVHPKSWTEDLARSLSKTYADLQVFEYTESWRTSPPRLR